MDKATHKRRKIAWLAISKFYLDTELDDGDYEEIYSALRKTDFDISELKRIDLMEVYPTLQHNLFDIAGEWAGFNEEWLFEKCLTNYKRQNNHLFKLTHRSSNVLFY